MFWRFGGAAASALDSLLDKDDVALEDVLDEPELLQHCKISYSRLVEYFCRPATAGQLLRFVTHLHQVPIQLGLNDANNDGTTNAGDPAAGSPNAANGEGSADPNAAAPAGNDGSPPLSPTALAARQEKLLIKYPYLVTEIFSSDMTDLLDVVLATPEHMAALLSFLDLPIPVNPVQAAHWSKIMSNLLIRKTKLMLECLKQVPGFVARLVTHAMDNANVMDLLLKLVGVEELVEGKAVGSMAWLQSEGLIAKLVAYLDPNQSLDVHVTASSALLDIIAMIQAISGDVGRMDANPLVGELKSAKVVSQLIGFMLDVHAPHPASSLVNGVAIFVELIRRNSADMSAMFASTNNGGDPAGGGGGDNGDGNAASADRPVPMNLCAMIRALTLHLPDFQQILLSHAYGIRDNPSYDPTNPKKIPLGQARLRLCELLAELLRCAIDEAIMDPVLDAATGDAIITPDLSVLDTLASELAAELPPAVAEAAVPVSPTSNESTPTTASSSVAVVARSSTADSLAAPVRTSSMAASVAVHHATPRPSPVVTANGSHGPPTPVPTVTFKEDPAAAAAAGISSDASTPTATSSQKSVALEKRRAELAGLSGEELQAALRQAFVSTRILVTSLDLFFYFPWNNLLHGIVYDMVLQVLNGPADKCRLLALSLLRDGALTRRIPRAQRASDYEAERPKGVRLGFMGHITLIADVVVAFLDRDEPMRLELTEMLRTEDWQEYVTRTFRETREREARPLGGVRPSALGGLSTFTGAAAGAATAAAEEDEDDSALEVAGGVSSDQFARYLCQQISGELPDRFGFTVDDDEDDEEDLDWGGDLIRSPFTARGGTDSDSIAPSPTKTSFSDSEPLANAIAGAPTSAAPFQADWENAFPTTGPAPSPSSSN
ncbi:hypothetical protein AMAG_07050 [Allomyces macrogynus ATCC 38327]|uniref:SAPS domain-containing protein n=1 Tax=Allomyces macrogynus (strain ATCC 38327) TaxID=578462 RepID=A0A0L0SFT0_ALLM3|nr:hypothetical protein AMAG_07050 [Allomyces macrogynus ATCC 38327]|eukprot:KNE61312.1 hypothetical protein AMAG_07050 [Allomyces macrogynus ATCC 38327]